MYYYHHWSKSPLRWLFNNPINPDPLAERYCATFALDSRSTLKIHQTDGCAWSCSEHYDIGCKIRLVHAMLSQSIDRENNKAARHLAATLHRTPVTRNKTSAASLTKIRQCVGKRFKESLAEYPFLEWLFSKDVTYANSS